MPKNSAGEMKGESGSCALLPMLLQNAMEGSKEMATIEAICYEQSRRPL